MVMAGRTPGVITTETESKIDSCVGDMEFVTVSETLKSPAGNAPCTMYHTHDDVLGGVTGHAGPVPGASRVHNHANRSAPQSPLASQLAEGSSGSRVWQPSSSRKSSCPLDRAPPLIPPC
eukprot:2693861-Prymnesium_polylepis.1